jgi:hypothetical protein
VEVPFGEEKCDDAHAFRQLFADLPDAAWDVKTQIHQDNVLLMEWSADAARSRVDDGVDTFVFRDGLI